MTKAIKIILIVLGFVVLMAIKMAFKANGSEGGLIYVLFMGAFLAYASAIWKYKKKTDDNNKLDKTL